MSAPERERESSCCACLHRSENTTQILIGQNPKPQWRKLAKKKKGPLRSWSEQWAVSSKTEDTDAVGSYLVELWRRILELEIKKKRNSDHLANENFSVKKVAYV